MQTRQIDEPGFAAEASAFLERVGHLPGLTDYRSLLAARARTANPAVSGRPDPAVASADLYLPARGGPVLARLYARRGAAGPRPVLLWLHGGGFVGGSVNDIDHLLPAGPSW
jgi:acetyl esterase